ncbi:toxin-antitoxin system YwqK family antitoxin [Bacteroidota bacterium]
MDRTTLLIFVTIALVSSCSRVKQEETSQSSDSGIRVVKEYYPDGSLKSETEALGQLRHGDSKEYRKNGTLESVITYENNRKQGKAMNYYPDGKTVKAEVIYVDGYKHGESKWYYPSGKIYRKTPYVRGVIQGIRSTYYEEGPLQAEIPYLNGQPGMGLKEYSISGIQKEFKGVIVFREKDMINLDNTFRLSISLSDKNRNVEFYSGELSEGRFWNEKLTPITTENGIGILDFYISRGSYKMETINIVAKVKTSLDNYYIIQQKYHLALENKF